MDPVPEVGEKPNQPTSFAFPKREFGKARIVKRSFQSSWFARWPWLHYDCSRDSAFCHVCVKAVKEAKMRLTSGNVKDSTFISGGFHNWKDAIPVFTSHNQTTTHKTATEVVVTLPHTTDDVGELLSSAHAQEKHANRMWLVKVFENILFLARQGLAMRGHGDDADSNFMQLVRLRAIDNPQFLTWIERKTNKYTSPQVQNELINVMAQSIVRNIASSIRKAKYFSIMADEVTDASNKEQVVICFRRVDDQLEAHEDFVGLYMVESIQSDNIVHVLTDTMTRMNLSINNCRGQCYDGASNMAGSRKGVVTQIRALEPRAMYTHCYGHALNLAVSDTVKQNKILRDVLDITFEISKLVKFSPKRDAMFTRLKEELVPGTIGFRTLCPTRWTVRAASLHSVLENYAVFQALWQKVKESRIDSEIRARVTGVEAAMNKFDFLFGLMLGERLLRHTDNLSKTLQNPSMTASEGQNIADLTVKTLSTMRSEEAFDIFWKQVEVLRQQTGLSEAALSRKRKAPFGSEVGRSEGYHPSSPKEYYRRQYFECFDFIVSSIRDRFNQPGYTSLLNTENLLLKAAKGDNYGTELAFVQDYYGDDVILSSLATQLELLTTAFTPQLEEVTLSTIKSFLQSLSLAQKASFSEVCKVLCFVLVTPATNAVSERSASALRRVKTYLRSTMSQVRLNNLLVLHAHKAKTDTLSISSCLNEFVAGSEHRLRIFGKFD